MEEPRENPYRSDLWTSVLTNTRAAPGVTFFGVTPTLSLNIKSKMYKKNRQHKNFFFGDSSTSTSSALYINRGFPQKSLTLSWGIPSPTLATFDVSFASFPICFVKCLVGVNC
ncbi:hypothetical protein J6590_034778 [Homalodisca vitripennis]|nr:hypothetical protein J6590_034778 [Homalodisca vitripennis]